MWNKLKQWLHPDHITRGSIKEGFDDLPAAVCYFTLDGIIRLCNRQMFRVYRALSGQDLQSLEELHQQVLAPTHGRRVDGKNPSFVLPDGTCWLYSEQTVLGMVRANEARSAVFAGGGGGAPMWSASFRR